MGYRYFYFLCLTIFLLIISQLFIASSKLKSKDHIHQNHFNQKYGIFSIIKPDSLDFAGEIVPIHVPNIWERLDKELLKNIYWQSNTLLYIKRANKYFPIIEPILKQHNIPDDFKYLAVIESGLEDVVSPSGAAGFWQLLKGTAREYEIEVNSSIDERYNLEKSTHAACFYLQEAYEKFGSWTMAAASYNMGKNGARRVICEQNTDNYYNLYVNSETRRYVFRIIAVKEILENPNKYGFIYRAQDLYNMPEYKIIEVDSTIVDLYVFCNEHHINYKLLKELNPWIRKSVLPDASRKKYQIKIPLYSSKFLFNEIKDSSCVQKK